MLDEELLDRDSFSELELFLDLLELESSIFEDEDSSSVLADADESSPQATVMDRNVSAKKIENLMLFHAIPKMWSMKLVTYF